jgi:hypothetical protein
MSNFIWYEAGRYGDSAPDATTPVSAQLAYYSGVHQRDIDRWTK